MSRLAHPASIAQRAPMRRSLLVAILLGLSASAFAADVSFVHVWPQWRGADAFDRIREYFGGAENDGSDLVVRTHPDQRAGLYFLVRVKATTEVGRATFVLDVIRPDAPQPRRFTFPVTLRSKARWRNWV